MPRIPDIGGGPLQGVGPIRLKVGFWDDGSANAVQARLRRAEHSCLPCLVDRGLDQPDADRAEAVQSVEDLYFSTRKRRGAEMIREPALLFDALCLDDAAVDANGPA